MRQAVFGAGLQKDHRGPDRAGSRGVQQQLPEHLSGQGRGADGAGDVHVFRPVRGGPQRGRRQAAAGVRVRGGDGHPADADGAQREPAGDLHRGLYPEGGVGVHLPRDSPRAGPHTALPADSYKQRCIK